MQKAANRPGARPYAGLPAGGEQVVTTQTVEVWRNKVKSEGASTLSSESDGSRRMRRTSERLPVVAA